MDTDHASPYVASINIEDARVLSTHCLDAFLPERWFGKDAPAVENTIRLRFFPFHTARRSVAGKNSGAYRDADSALLDFAAFPLLEGPGVVYEEWEGKIQDWFVVHQEPLLVDVSLRE